MIQYIDQAFEDAIERGYEGPGWYFWDETSVYCYGPFQTEAEASEGELDYARALEGLRP